MGNAHMCPRCGGRGATWDGGRLIGCRKCSPTPGQPVDDPAAPGRHYVLVPRDRWPAVLATMRPRLD